MITRSVPRVSGERWYGRDWADARVCGKDKSAWFSGFRFDQASKRRDESLDNSDEASQNLARALLASVVPPRPSLVFSVVNDGRSFAICEVPEAEDALLGWLRPRIHLVQSFPNRSEAEAFLQFASSIRPSPSTDREGFRRVLSV